MKTCITNDSPRIKTLMAFFLTAGLFFLVSCSKESVVEVIDTIEEGIETEESLDNLNGGWIRVASNNPNADGIIITMSGTSGTIKDKANSGFSVGDIKWKDIKAVDAENFTHQELGSDSNYYEASMILKADDTLRIAVGSSGAGNSQKWVREGQYTPTEGQGPDSTETLSCSISEATTLSNGTAAVDYFIDCVVDVTAPLTIEPGTVIQFGDNVGLGIYDGGALKAKGTAEAPIVLEGMNSVDGYWRGIHIETRSFDNQLEHVRISDAGSNYVYCCNNIASLYLKGAKISIQNVQIANGGGLGFMATNGTEFEAYSNVRIETHDDYPIHIEASTAGSLDGTGSDYSGNAKDYVFIPDNTISEPTTWSKLNVPYLMEGQVLDVTEAFTLKEGVEMIFQENGGIGVYDQGSLTVQGTANAPVTMKGFSPVPGYWRGVHIETNSLENSLDYLELSDAGSNYVYCCNTIASLFFKDGTASVTNTKIDNGKSYGIATQPNFRFNTYGGNTITGHQLEPMYLAASTLGQLDGTGSTYLGNDSDYLLIYNSDIDEATSVRANDVPFLVGTNVVIDITEPLTLQAGVEMAFGENAGLGVYDNGTLNAEGEANNTIVFRGLQDEIGFWRGIHIETNSSNNVFSNAEIKNGGGNYVYCCNPAANIFLKDGQLTVEYSTIMDSGGCGILVRSGATLTERGNVFQNNQDGHICN